VDDPAAGDAGQPPAPAPALEQHWHLHLHGASANQFARVLGQVPGRMPGAPD
jgi:hypothetical protein